MGRSSGKTLNTELEFALTGGWTIAVFPKRPEGDCQEFASVVNAPYRAHRDLYIDTSYGWTAEEEASASPREFRFVTNCSDYRTEYERLSIAMWPYTATPRKVEEAMAQLATSPLGKGTAFGSPIRESATRATRPRKRLGRIEWMKFSVEIILPQTR